MKSRPLCNYRYEPDVRVGAGRSYDVFNTVGSCLSLQETLVRAFQMSDHSLNQCKLCAQSVTAYVMKLAPFSRTV